MVQLPPVSASAASAELADALNTLLSNDSLRRDIAQKALMVCERNRGATERTLDLIANLLEKPKPSGESIPFPALSITAAK